MRGRRSRLRWQLTLLQMSLLLVVLGTLASVLLLRASIDMKAETQDLRLARATCQTLFYAIAEAAKMRYEGEGPTCTLTMDDGREVRWRWQASWWVREKLL